MKRLIVSLAIASASSSFIDSALLFVYRQGKQHEPL